MASQQDFKSFLMNIEPSSSTVEYISSVQINLRKYLKDHSTYGKIYVDTFLSGSYAKHTSIRPVKNDKKRDVDIIVVTNHSKEDNPEKVLRELYDVLDESSTYVNARIQHHSIGIELGQISIDVVPVIVDVNDSDLYWLPDSKRNIWLVTDPKGHIQWSTATNQENNNKYKPLVKFFKWWRRVNCPEKVKYPKGITLEKLIADKLGDSSGSIEDLLIETMQNIVSEYKEQYVDKGKVPFLGDPSEKVGYNDLLAGYSFAHFKAFIEKLNEHLTALSEDGAGNDTWRRILGTEFPREAKPKSSANAYMCEHASHRLVMPWIFSRGGIVFIALEVKDKTGTVVQYESNGDPLDKGCSLTFRAITGVKPPYMVKWQVTNTGIEATNANCLRGNFEDSDGSVNIKHESTSYSGSHSVQCFIIKKGICVAKSKDYIINIK